MTTKNNKRVYSKPIVKKPVEKIEEQIEKTAPVAIDPEVFDIKPAADYTAQAEPMTVQPYKVEPMTVGEIKESLEKNHNVDAEAELNKMLEDEQAELNRMSEVEIVKVLEKNHNVDAQAELEADVTFDQLNNKEINFPANNTFNKQVEIEILPRENTGLVYAEDYHPDPNVERTLRDKDIFFKSPVIENSGTTINYIDMSNVSPKIQGEYSLVEKQANGEMKIISSESSKQKTLDSLSQHDLRHFQRTGQMPK